jgi:hypothetical protein
MIVRADFSMVGVVARDKTAGKGMALGVGTITLGQGVLMAMAIGAPMSELGVRESILDSPSFFKPGSLRFQFSGLGID